MLLSTNAGLQLAFNSFADACDTARIKIKTKHSQTEVLHFSRNPDQCSLQVNGATLKQVEKIKYLRVPWGTRIRSTTFKPGRLGAGRFGAGRFGAAN